MKFRSEPRGVLLSNTEEHVWGQHRLNHAPQTLQPERSTAANSIDPTILGLLSGDRQCRFTYVNAQNRQSQRGNMRAKSLQSLESSSAAPMWGRFLKTETT
jgi:hypothetical protein